MLIMAILIMSMLVVVGAVTYDVYTSAPDEESEDVVPEDWCATTSMMNTAEFIDAVAKNERPQGAHTHRRTL